MEKHKVRDNMISIYLLVIVIVNSYGSMISFKAYPSELKANITSAASMRCELMDTDTRRTVTNTSLDILHVTSILITDNEGQAVAHASVVDAPTALKDLNNLDVKGSVSGTSSTGYLELSWRIPSLMSVGQYSCEVTTINSQRHNTVFLTSLELTRVPPSLNDLVVMLQTQQQTIQNNEAKVQQTIQNIETKHAAELTSLKSENAAQAEMIRNQSLEISKIKSCVSPIVGFMAAISGSGQLPHIATNSPVVYDTVLTDTSSSYDPHTGVFHTPVSGLYHFSVNCVTVNKAGLTLFVNSTTVTSTIAWDSDSSWESCSMAATIELQRGDEVHVKSSTGSYADMYQNSNVPQPNVFSGHLLTSADCTL